jgi:hypothetical protein
MRTEILYVELIQGHSGPAWIGYGQFNKSGRTVYFNGKVFGRAQGIIGNHVDIKLGDEYWISGVKKNGEDRHWAGSGKIHIDNSVIDDYLKIIGETTLPKNKFMLVDLNNVPNKDLSREIENKKISEHSFDRNLLHKDNPKDLKDDELKKVLNYYSKLDLTEYHIKARKGYVDIIDALTNELEERNKNNLA